MQINEDNTSIRNLIHSFSSAFNAADIVRTVSLFTDDGILMPNNAPLSTGKEQLSASYQLLFESFKINIEYTIDEITISGDHAFVRTKSTVATHVKESGQDVSLVNKEIFVLRGKHNDWKISIYIFNNTSTTK